MRLFQRSSLRLGPRYHDPDWWLLAILLTLVMFGTVMIFSSTSGMSAGEGVGANGFLIRQLIFAGLGLAALFVTMHIDYHLWRALALPALGIVVVVLILVLIVTPEINGTHQWFVVGPIQIQPSELAKPAIIVYLASWLCSKGDQVRSFNYGLVQFGLVMGFVVGLVMLEPDLGTSILLMTVGVAMFFVAGAHLVQFFGALIVCGAASLMVALSASYRRERLLAFLDPEANTADTGWHLLQARLALGDGGIFGVGLGASRQKFTWLPAAHNDAIFAVIGEELGLIGATFVLVLFGVLGYRGYRIARRAPDQFGMLLAVGVTTWIIFQAVFNIGGVTAAIPFTGITLPFISYGGSSLLVSMAAFGILLNISRQTAEYPAARAPSHDQTLQPAAAMMAAARHEQVLDSTQPFDLTGRDEASYWEARRLPGRERRRQ